MKIEKYSDLVVWSEGMDLAEEIYRVTASFPGHEKYLMSVQMRRAAVSIPSNIAEGYARFFRREYRRFVTMALGSLAELETHLELVKRLGYIDSEQQGRLKNKMTVLGSRLQRLRQALEK